LLWVADTTRLRSEERRFGLGSVAQELCPVLFSPFRCPSFLPFFPLISGRSPFRVADGAPFLTASIFCVSKVEWRFLFSPLSDVALDCHRILSPLVPSLSCLYVPAASSNFPFWRLGIQLRNPPPVCSAPRSLLPPDSADLGGSVPFPSGFCDPLFFSPPHELVRVGLLDSAGISYACCPCTYATKSFLAVISKFFFSPDSRSRQWRIVSLRMLFFDPFFLEGRCYCKASFILGSFSLPIAVILILRRLVAISSPFFSRRGSQQGRSFLWVPA